MAEGESAGEHEVQSSNQVNAISDFRELVHTLLGDEIDEPEHSDEAIDRSLRQALMCGLVPGFTVDGTRTLVVPEIFQANDYLLLGAEAAWSFVRVESEFQSFKVRAYAETTRKSIMLQAQLQDTIYKLRNGAMFFAGWQSLYSWLVGVAGLTGRDVGFMLTRLNVQVPIGQVTVAAGGLTSS